MSEPEISVSAVMEAHASTLQQGNILGERFGKYLLIGEVATGGMAELFLAVNKGPEGFLKVVVIKRVLQHLTRNPEFVEMFINEARIAARLEHPNIVRTYEFGEVDGQYFTAMEYLPGEDLCKILNNLATSKQLMPPALAAGIALQLCNGLQFAHGLTDLEGRPLRLVHRDINPANIVITYGGEVKLIDFGVAKSDGNARTMVGTIKGKIAYMPPEQLLGHAVDQRADVFSAGVVLWELLTGRPLFLREYEAATLQAVMNAPIISPDLIRPSVPPPLAGIAMRALSRAPDDRYATAEQMAVALENAMTRMPRSNARQLATTLEGLFGFTRANAKRSIAQTRSLSNNVSLVMKLRSEVRADLAERLDTVVSPRPGSSGDHAVHPRATTLGMPGAEPASAVGAAAGSVRSPRQRAALLALAAIVLGGIAAGLGHAMLRANDEHVAASVAETAVQIDSTPPGAAVFVGGEPTGLRTPAKLIGITRRRLVIRLELPGHAPAVEQVEVPVGVTTELQIALTELPGRLIVSGLPAGASIIVDGVEHDAGDVIAVTAGNHAVRVVLDGRILAEQSIATGAGNRAWRLLRDKLISN
jgi:serine/threonine protein kinase